MQHESDGDTNYDWCARNSPQRLSKRAEKIEIEGRTQTIQSTVLILLARILRRFRETC